MARINFSFIPNHISFDCDLPLEIMDAYTITKANDEQIKFLELHLNKLGYIVGNTNNLPYKVSYQLFQIPDETAQIIQIKTEPIDREDWKYYIVSHDNDGVLLYKFQLASNLLNQPIEFDIFNCDTHEDEYIFGYTPDLVFRFFSDNDLTIQHIHDADDMQFLKDIYLKIYEIETEYEDIYKSITLLNSLRYLPKYNEFKILGYFTVVESLLTHKQTKTETGDSLSRQIKTKVPLLLNRISDGINYNKYFHEASEEKIWAKLYSYRSALAHGSNVNFNGELQVLKSPLEIHDFMIACVKKLLTHSLYEPKLVRDLKNC